MPRQGNKGKSLSGSKSVKLVPGFYPSLDRIVETTLGPLNLGPGGGSYNEPISCLQCAYLFLMCIAGGIWFIYDPPHRSSAQVSKPILSSFIIFHFYIYYSYIISYPFSFTIEGNPELSEITHAWLW